jgi:DNA-binding SARP family transcriptional activator
MITCRVLGPIEVIVDQGPAPADLLWRKHLALLLYLARSPKRARTREHLCGLLWPEKAESTARHSLNEALRVLRRSGVGEGLDTSAGQIRLAPDAVRLDADALESLLSGDAWARAAELVAGVFLEGFAVPGATAFEEWLAAERRHWTARSLVALLGWSGDLLRQGRAEEALLAAERAEALDPLSDATACAVMAALAGRGDPGAALAHAERHAGRLGELGVVPGEASRLLAERIRRGRGRTRPAIPQSSGTEPRRAPLVGRADQLRRLLDVWDRCREKPGAAAVVLQGDSGTGKTRLLEEMASRAVLSGGAVTLMRAVEGDLEDEGSCLRGLARGGLLDAPGIPGAAPAALAAFAAVLPEWGERFRSVPGESPLEPARAFPAIVSAATSEGPLLLVVDDAQWADRASLLGLLALLRDLSGAPLCLVLATTPHPPREELDELRRRLGSSIPGIALSLAPLDGDALRRLAHWALPSYSSVALERVARRVASDSAGIPFLAVELLSAVAQGLDLKQGTSAWPAPSRTLTQSLPSDLPDTVVAAIRIGFRRLGEDARQVLTAAAVLGGRGTEALLARATGLPPDRVHAALDELEWQRWLEVDSQGYGFVASLARQVVARDMVTPGQQARLRQRSGFPPELTMPPAT